MRFLRHSGIYRSDVLSLLVNSGQGAASRWSGPAQAIGRDGRCTPCPSSAMSSGRLILDRVARQHCPSPLHQQPQHKSIAVLMKTNYHRTVTSVLTPVSPQGTTLVPGYEKGADVREHHEDEHSHQSMLVNGFRSKAIRSPNA